MSAMELRCLQSPTVSSIVPSAFVKTPFLSGKTLIKLPSHKRNCRDITRIKMLHLRARASGTTKIKAQAQDATSSNASSKDGNVVFVAGATGKVGSRTVRELLKLGFNVRAGVRSKKRAEPLVQSVRKIKLEDVAGGTQPIDKLELVECDLEKQYQIVPALGNSSIIICCIGASEKEIFDITGPYRIDYQATKNLIDAATSAKVDQFILLTSLGTNKVGFPAAILNLFWGVLVWKRKAEEALLASGLPYTIVRPGGMERPTDSYKETHNITLSEEDTLFGGQVSNLQVAELMAVMAKNRNLSCCKVVEVIAETTAPLTPMEELLKKIPSGREGVCPPKDSDVASKPQQVPDITYAEKEPEQAEKPTLTTPLSPYAAYEDLKPPTSPTPTPSTGAGVTKASNIEITPNATSSISSSTEVIPLETSGAVTENVIPETASKKQYSLSPYASYEDLKPPTSPTPTPSTGSGTTKAAKIVVTPNETTSISLPSEVNPSETSTISVDDVTSQVAPKKPTPLSPYANYEDLKPPTSPTPTPSTGSGTTKDAKIDVTPNETTFISSPVEVNSTETSTIAVDDVTSQLAPKKQNPLSPYANYEDLKPPTSPTPTPSGSKKEPSVVSDDIKPPSIPTIPENGKPDTSVDEKSETINHHSEPKAQPLSPYTMYEDLKPPSSPIPRKL